MDRNLTLYGEPLLWGSATAATAITAGMALATEANTSHLEPDPALHPRQWIGHVSKDHGAHLNDLPIPHLAMPIELLIAATSVLLIVAWHRIMSAVGMPRRA